MYLKEKIMKKILYIVLWVVLGLMLSFILHAIIEIAYLRWAEANNVIVKFVLGGSCALPLWLIILLPILGVIFGLWVGQIAWNKVYVEKILGNKVKLSSK